MRKNYLLIIALISIVSGAFLYRYAELVTNKLNYPEDVKSVLSAKCAKALHYFEKLEYSSDNELPTIIERADQDGIILLVYNTDSLVFWSSNSVPIFEIYIKDLLKPRIVKLLNSYYYLIKEQKGEKIYIGLINIKIQYPYENDFLHSGFNPDFNLPENAVMGFNPEEGFAVKDQDGTFLFSIVVPDTTDSKSPGILIGLVFNLLGFIFLAIWAFILIGRQNTQSGRRWTSIFVISSIIVLRIGVFISGIRLSGIPIFDAYLFADSWWVSSLGDLLVNSVCLFYIALIIFRYAKLSEFFRKNNRRNNAAIQIALLVVYYVFFAYAYYFSKSLIFNSNISFQPNEIDQLTFYSLISILIDGINYLSAALILIWLLRTLTAENNNLKLFIVFIITSLLLIAGVFITGSSSDILSVLFFYFFSLFFLYFMHRKKEIFRYSVWTLLLLIFSIYLVAFVAMQSAIKEERVRSSLALSLANEHDPVAEYLLKEISTSMDNDTILKNRLTDRPPDVTIISDYLKKNYFRGYWNKYDLTITVCRPVDSVLIEIPDYQWFPCYPFFGQIIRDVGLKLPNSKFYYLDDLTGRISYLGKYSIPVNVFPYEISLYIELDSKLSNDFLGYPELLLNKNLQSDRLIDQYSYAKYHKKELIARHGDFSYSLSTDLFGASDKQFRTVRLDGYTHLLYQSGKDNLIVLSLPTIRFMDLLVGFSYIFLVFYICILLVFAIRNLNQPGFRFLSDLRNKIQVTIIAVLLTSMILIASISIWLSLSNYRSSQDKILHEKIQSILVELSRRIGIVTDLSSDWNSRRYDNLNQLLIRYSDAYFSDINLYYPTGDLLATSRLEIFQTGLQGEKMDPVALFEMQKEKRAQFIHREKIGSLSYRSAYVPFKNSQGKLLAYLNLPYFTKQSELQAALSTLVVTIINIYIILILITIVITVLISNQITKPLNMLQQRFRQLKLGDKYEQIQYERKDEIGSLVAEYNKMVIELERSFDLLARSERESAWREMAKQIAHEIKNPLTPMRLSVQQLQKIWKEKREDYDSYLGNVTATLIEQIDNLSAIASEFSNFAKMPAINIASVDLVDLIARTVELFGGSDAYSINYKASEEHITINADREQLSRVFMNLIKNAIQSIPESRKGKINITIEKEEKQVAVIVSDNGNGIPDDVKPKLFTPNFTTKSSGMGLGLTIVRNILDQLAGEISYTTKPGAGTKFTIKIPLPTRL
jgi:two-component system, NtrC family, nitrogen regulation sensor histidine kinase NtrY